MPRFDIYRAFSYPADSFKKLSAYNPFGFGKKGTRAKALFALSLVCFFWGTTWIASKQAVESMPALQMAGIRQFLGGICYVLFFVIKGTRWPRGREWNSILVLSLLNFVLSNGLSTWALKYIDAGLGAILGAIFPLWIVIIGLFGTRVVIPRKAIIGLLAGFAGVCLIFSDQFHKFLNAEFITGIVLSLIATWTWAFGTIYTKKHAAEFNPYFSLGLQMLISGISLFSISHISKQTIPVNTIPWEAWASIAYLVVFGSVISFIAYLYALQNLSAEQASIYAYVNPIVAVFFGWLIFSEKITLFIVAGGIIALYGVHLVNKAYKTPRPEMPEAEGV